MPAALKRGFGLLVTAGVAIGIVPVAGGSAAPPCTPTPAPGDETAMTAMVNAKRKAAKLAEMAPNAVLSRAGRRKSMSMAGGGAFSHADSMAWAQGRAAAQNIAMAPTARAAFKAMWASAPHHKNMMGAAWRLTGIGAAHDCSGQTFYTLNFAAPAS